MTTRPRSKEESSLLKSIELRASGMRVDQSNHRCESRWAFLWTLGSLLVLLAPFTARGEPPVPPVTSVSDNPRLPGKFIWADLVTYDLAAAREFYFSLFNWRFDEFGNYTVAYNEDRPICGMFHRKRPEGHPEATSRWFGYISVPNVKQLNVPSPKPVVGFCRSPEKFRDVGNRPSSRIRKARSSA